MSPTVQAALDRLKDGIVPDLIELVEIAAEVRRLSEDAKRLDWLEKNGECLNKFPTDAGMFWAASKRGKYARCEDYARTARAAIDAAMKGTT